MSRPGNRPTAFWRAAAPARTPASPTAIQIPSAYATETGRPTVRHAHLLFWGSAWEGMVERRKQIVAAFQAALSDGSMEAASPLVLASVISTATHTSPGDPPELLAHADVTALVANLMSKRALSPWNGPGAALYCVVLRSPLSPTSPANGRERFAYTAYRQNMRDIHCGWLFCQDDAELVAECARKLLAEVESALLTDAV